MKKNMEKINHFKVVCYWGFATHPPTLLYAISIQKILIILDDPLATFLCHLRSFDVQLKSKAVISTLSWSFWWFNERSKSIIKRYMGGQSLRKLMILRSILWNQFRGRPELSIFIFVC